MANVNKPFGMRLVGTLSGAPVSGQIKKFYTAHASAIYVGDIVKLSGTAGHVGADDAYYPAVEICATSAAAVGVVVGFEPIATDLSIRYHVATSAVPKYVLVSVDPMALYEIQGDDGVWAVTDVGQSADIVAGGTGNNTTGVSYAVADLTSGQADDSLIIVGISPVVGNELGAYCRLLVKLNLNQYASNGVTGV